MRPRLLLLTLAPTHFVLESAPAAARAWAGICRFGRFAASKTTRRSLRGQVSDPAVRYITAGISQNSLSRIASWANILWDFLADEALKEGHARIAQGW